MSATSIEVSEPGTLHAPCMLRLLSLLGSSSAQVQSDGGLETSRPPRVLAFIKLSAGSRLNQAYFGSAELAFVRRSKSPSKHLLWQRRFASERGLGTSETSRSPRVLSFHQALSRQPAEAYFGSAELAFVRRSKSQSKHLLWQRQLASERGLDTSDTISHVFIASLNSHVFIATLNSHPYLQKRHKGGWGRGGQTSGRHIDTVCFWSLSAKRCSLYVKSSLQGGVNILLRYRVVLA